VNIHEIVKFYGGTDAAAGAALGVSRERVGHVRRGGRTAPIEWQLKCEKDSKRKLRADVCKACGQPT
jgi:hypothetical protein